MDASKLDALQDLIHEVDGEGPPTAEQQQAASAETDLEQAAREWGSIVFMVGHAAAMIAPELRQVYTEDACINWGRAMVPVAKKYGWDGPSNVPELGLLIASAGLVVPSVFAIRARLHALRDTEKPAGWLGGLRDWWQQRRAGKAAAAAAAAPDTAAAAA